MFPFFLFTFCFFLGHTFLFFVVISSPIFSFTLCFFSKIFRFFSRSRDRGFYYRFDLEKEKKIGKKIFSVSLSLCLSLSLSLTSSLNV